MSGLSVPETLKGFSPRLTLKKATNFIQHITELLSDINTVVEIKN